MRRLKHIQVFLFVTVLAVVQYFKVYLHNTPLVIFQYIAYNTNTSWQYLKHVTVIDLKITGAY